MKLRLMLLAATVAAASLRAQTAAEHIALGDRAHAAMNAVAALRHYQDALQVDSLNLGALWRAAREAIDLGEFDPTHRDSLYALGERYARRAVAVDSTSSIAHFALAKALGRKALTMGARDRVRFAAEVRAEALEALRLDPTNSGAMHVMGMWHANVMRLNGVSRFLAKNLLGGKVFEEANWNDAIAFLERAAALEPDRIVHKLNLAAIHADSGNRARARELYQAVLRMRHTDVNDPHYQRQAATALQALN